MFICCEFNHVGFIGNVGSIFRNTNAEVVREMSDCNKHEVTSFDKNMDVFIKCFNRTLRT